MLDKLRELTRGPLRRGPIHVMAGDTIALNTTDRVTGRTHTVLSHPVTRAATYTDGVIFEAEEDGRAVVGGYFIEMVKAP